MYVSSAKFRKANLQLINSSPQETQVIPDESSEAKPQQPTYSNLEQIMAAKLLRFRVICYTVIDN